MSRSGCRGAAATHSAAAPTLAGADMSILVRDALMEPIRTLQTATHFRRVRGEDKDGNMQDDMMAACSPGAEGAEAMTLMDLADPNKLLEPVLCRVSACMGHMCTRATDTHTHPHHACRASVTRRLRIVLTCLRECGAQEHFDGVLQSSNPSVAAEDLAPFEEFTASYGQEGA
jgi:hypothetical protein